MPQDTYLHVPKRASNGSTSPEEAQSLLTAAANDDSADITPPSPPPEHTKPHPPRRQSSLAPAIGNGSPRTPRTANRVRFDIEERRSAEIAANGHASQNGHLINGHANGSSGNYNWGEVEEEDYMLSGNGGRRSSTGQRAPLLTDIEAPSVTQATEGDGLDMEELVEGRGRAKSGMRSAFMNMANSIIGAGIIGQPYAFRQAGLATGILLLVALTITVRFHEDILGRPRLM